MAGGPGVAQGSLSWPLPGDDSQVPVMDESPLATVAHFDATTQ